jgi:hypothetical protein
MFDVQETHAMMPVQVSELACGVPGLFGEVQNMQQERVQTNVTLLAMVNADTPSPMVGVASDVGLKPPAIKHTYKKAQKKKPVEAKTIVKNKVGSKREPSEMDCEDMSTVKERKKRKESNGEDSHGQVISTDAGLHFQPCKDQ